GEDSFSFLDILENKHRTSPVREATVHHSIEGRFAIRQGPWKLILWPGSGGWSAPREASELKGLPPYQLYELDKDPEERQNLYSAYPEKVASLKKLLKAYIDRGRSTPGKPQRNDPADNWPGLDWMQAGP